MVFLGFLIDTSRIQTTGKARFKGRTILQRHPATFVRIYANKKKVIETLLRSGFCDQAGEPKPNWVVALQPPQSFSVSRVASIIRGLDNYYKVLPKRRTIEGNSHTE